MLHTIAFHYFTTGKRDPQGDDMVAESPFMMMVLSVDIACNGAANGDELGSGCNRKKPAARYGPSKQCVETQSRLTTETSGYFIECQ